MDTAGMRSLREILEYRAQEIPDELFVRFDPIEDEPISYSFAEFDGQVNRAANMLRTLGLNYGDKINLHLGNCMEFLFLWFAAAKINAGSGVSGQARVAKLDLSEQASVTAFTDAWEHMQAL